MKKKRDEPASKYYWPWITGLHKIYDSVLDLEFDDAVFCR